MAIETRMFKRSLLANAGTKLKISISQPEIAMSGKIIVSTTAKAGDLILSAFLKAKKIDATARTDATIPKTNAVS